MTLGTGMGMLHRGTLGVPRSVTMAPDAILASANLTGTVGDIDEPVDSPDANWLTADTLSTDTYVRVSFPTPDPSLSGTQRFRAYVRRADADNADCKVELYEAGTAIATLSATVVTSSTGEIVTGDWTASDVSSAADVECRIYNPRGTSNEGLDIGAIEWQVNV